MWEYFADGEAGADGDSQKKKAKKKRADGREISPIEWDKSEEESEKSDEEDDDDDVEDDKSDISNESLKSNKSGNKSDSETERRRNFFSFILWLFRTNKISGFFVLFCFLIIPGQTSVLNLMWIEGKDLGLNLL